MARSRTPSVTAIIPTYNYGHFVCEAVDSVLAQDYPEMECVVVNDGSTDDTMERLQPYEDRITIIDQENRGLCGARNAGIRAAKGDYVAFLDSDDQWMPHKISRQMEYMLENGFEASATIGPEGSIPPEGPLDFADCCFYGPGFGSTGVVKKSLFDEVGMFDEELRSVEDREMMLRIARTGRRIGLLYEDLAIIRKHPDNMSNSAERMEKNFQTVIDKVFSWPEARTRYALRARAQSFVYEDATWTYFCQGQRLKALDRMLRAMALWPLPTGRYYPRPGMRRTKLLARILLGSPPSS